MQKHTHAHTEAHIHAESRIDARTHTLLIGVHTANCLHSVRVRLVLRGTSEKQSTVAFDSLETRDSVCSDALGQEWRDRRQPHADTSLPSSNNIYIDLVTNQRKSLLVAVVLVTTAPRPFMGSESEFQSIEANWIKNWTSRLKWLILIIAIVRNLICSNVPSCACDRKGLYGLNHNLCTI